MKTNKYIKTNENQEYSTFVNCAIVFSTTLREFDELKRMLKENSNSHLIYHRASLEKLVIKKESEMGGVVKNE